MKQRQHKNVWRKLSTHGQLYQWVLDHYNKTIIGQDHVKKLMAQVLSEIHQDLSQGKWALRVLFFKWPTGVGKTEIAKQTANLLFWDTNGLVNIPCEQLTQSHDSSRLFWAPPGYIWYWKTSFLSGESLYKAWSDAFRRNTLHKIAKHKQNMAIIVFDEIEKMHPTIVQSLLGLIDEGKATLSNGEEISLQETIIIFTSNVGETNARDVRASVGFWTSETAHKEKQLQEKEKIFNERFSPEFLGRLDHIIEFDPLAHDFIDQSINKYKIDLINDVLTFTDGRILVQFDDLSVDKYILDTIDPKKGNRNIKKIWENNVTKRIGTLIKVHKLTRYNSPHILEVSINTTTQELEAILKRDTHRGMVKIDKSGNVTPIHQKKIRQHSHSHLSPDKKLALGNFISWLQKKTQDT